MDIRLWYYIIVFYYKDINLNVIDEKKKGINEKRKRIITFSFPRPLEVLRP